MSTEISRRRFAALAAASVLAPAPLRAQSGNLPAKYPERAIKLVVPFAPGGVYDAFARPFAEKVKPYLGNVVIENVGGAGGAIGTAQVARAQPDGYTILLGGGGPFVIIPAASKKLNYDPQKDFEPVCISTLNGLAIAVHPSVPVKTLGELIAYIKANPGKLSYGSAGTGSATHLGAELFKSLINEKDLPHVPYKGSGQSLIDLVSGQIPLSFPNVTGQILALHNQDKIRILAMTTPERMRGAANIPTAIEAGLKDMIALNFTGLFVPAGTPGAIIDTIAQASRQVMAQNDFKNYLIESGIEPSGDDTPARTRRFLDEERARWGPVIKAINLQLG